MTITIVYHNPCRRERLRDAFAMNIHILGPIRTAQFVDAVYSSYQHHLSPRTNYNFALHALNTVAGIQGLAAACIIKEAWNEGSLKPIGLLSADNPTHPGLTPEGKRPIQ